MHTCDVYKLTYVTNKHFIWYFPHAPSLGDDFPLDEATVFRTVIVTKYGLGRWVEKNSILQGHPGGRKMHYSTAFNMFTLRPTAQFVSFCNEFHERKPCF